MTKVYNGHDNFSFPFSVFFFFFPFSSLCIFFWLVPLEGFCSGSFLPNDTFNSYLCFFVAYRMGANCRRLEHDRDDPQRKDEGSGNFEPESRAVELDFSKLLV